MMSRLAFVPLTAALFALSFAPSDARADEWEDFEAARSAYLTQDYPLAVQLLEALIGGEPSPLDNGTLLLESRKYLGAAELFLGHRAEADAQFERLVRADPTYEIDPIQFPQAVVDAFDAARARVNEALQHEADRAEQEAQRARADELRSLLRDEEMIRELEALAGVETIRTENSRWLAALPFGVGQFRNGNHRLGRAFAITESLFLALGLGSYFGTYAHGIRHWDPLNPPPTRLSHRGLESLNRFLHIANYTSMAAFGATAIAGIIEAQLNFRPEIVVTRPRPLPGDEVGGNHLPRPQLRLGLGPLGASATLSF